jgi:hypothetical protein
MTFTADDLKRLKEWWEHKAPGSSCDCMDYDTAQALLARLEAAEKFNSLARVILTKAHPDSVDAQMLNNAYEAWRKAKGL